jgi:hypothetical protein
MGDLSPVEEVFQRHMQRSLATYETYYKVPHMSFFCADQQCDD